MNKLIRISITISALLVVTVMMLVGQSMVELFEEGIVAYRDGRFEDAIRLNEGILQNGYASPEIYYNLGNAYYRLGRIGQAILAYERALKLDPSDEDIIHNLKLANLKTIDRIDKLPELFFVSWFRTLGSMFSLISVVMGLLVGWIILFFSLALAVVGKWVQFLKNAQITVTLSLIIVIFFGAILALQIFEKERGSEAIVISQVVTAKNSPDEQSTDAFVIHEGLKVDVGDSVEGWIKIILPDGKIGWVRSNVIEKI